jgi:hypothetical protein
MSIARTKRAASFKIAAWKAERVSLVDSIREAVGDQAAAALAKSFGGRHLYVPLVASKSHAIARAIGIRAAVSLSRRFGGAYMPCPRTFTPGRAEKLKRSTGVRRAFKGRSDGLKSVL